MSVKVKNFIIQAKAIERSEVSQRKEANAQINGSTKTVVSESVKEEIISECFDKVIQYLESKNKL
ncbi:MAG: hypothetical protein NWQ55_04125 [Salibacteraceae bacterium]|jgi:hypothetical protein|nr:hypothetical protein [Salibacteraceae bacterium]MDP4686058.1 hypothetical protein [Salibacteraceae bacterium]MDP4764681.1 hypothetical protein [Salibacteraceae bacterium]MDP4843984.1 hypothetical protein [Salibacteraceae bacterium]MDP4964238.1 hypothetical protein [Salibacteraceae bacterium]